MHTTSEEDLVESVPRSNPDANALPAAILAAVRSVIGPGGKVALHEPEFRGREWEYVKDCIDSGWVSSVGSFVNRFEKMLEEATGAKHAIATVNGTAALHVCLQLAGVRRGDEVLVPDLTFVATANAVSYLGAVPHFIDSERHTLGVDATKLEAYLQESAELRHDVCVNRRTGAVMRALVPMHTFGHPVDIESLLDVCARWHIVLVEDAAESLGSFYHERHTGTFGLLSALSFNGNKIVTTGGGGAILTNDSQLAERARHLTTTARVAHRWSFIHDEVGYNYRMPNLNAALGCAQLEMLASFVERKRRLAEQYRHAFRDLPGVTFFAEPAACRSNYWLNVILLERADLEERDAVLGVLNEAGLMSRPTWTLMHRLAPFADCPRMDLSCACELERSIVNLPSSACLAPDSRRP
jgi:perosamine synthetase